MTLYPSLYPVLAHSRAGDLGGALRSPSFEPVHELRVLEQWAAALLTKCTRIRLERGTFWRPASHLDDEIGMCKVLSGAVALGTAPLEHNGAAGWASEGWLPPWQQEKTSAWAVQTLSPVELLWYPGHLLEPEWLSKGARLGSELLALQHRWWKRSYAAQVARRHSAQSIVLFFWWSLGRTHKNLRYWNQSVSHQIQADLLGLSRSEVSRQLQALKKQNHLVADGLGFAVTVNGKAALERVLRESADALYC